MESKLDATYLGSGVIERAAAIAVVVVGVGVGVFLASWGISFLWRFTQNSSLTITQDKPFIFAQPEPFRIDPSGLSIKIEQPPAALDSRPGTNTSSPSGDVIRREVTVFFQVKHGSGDVVTGWNYKDGAGGTPVGRYCYYMAPNVDQSSTKVDIASNGLRLPRVNPSLVPDLEGALSKCQWSQR